jgi:hypothetical protein
MVGTPRKVVIDGVSYDVMNDTNITFNPTKYEVEGVATTGDTLFKRTKRVQSMEGVTISALPPILESLKDKADSLADKTMSVEFADGSVYKATGQINYENWESESGRATLQLLPKRGWEPFLAS